MLYAVEVNKLGLVPGLYNIIDVTIAVLSQWSCITRNNDCTPDAYLFNR